MASAESLKKVQEIYIAYYQRPGDPGGMRFWADRLDATGGNLSAIIDAFGTSPEALQLYGEVTAQTIGQVIDNIYQGLFGRNADAGGKAFYTAGFLDGTFTPASIAVNILNGAQNDDLVAIENKVTAADDFTGTVDGRGIDDPEFGTGGISQFAVSYSGFADAEAARGFLGDVTAAPESVPSAEETTIFVYEQIAENPGAREIFTLMDFESPEVPPTPPQLEVYWGYTPGDHGLDKGIPVSELIDFVTTITGLDLTELGLIDDDGVGPFDNVTDLSISNPFDDIDVDVDTSTSGAGGSELTITFADGSTQQFNIEAQIAEQYFEFLNNLLFDENGDSRLFLVDVSTGTRVPAGPDAAILTGTENNGFTVEEGFTTPLDTIIQAGRLDLLHGAYLDGGEGYNTLEVDAKGHFAQPKALVNIQQININNLGNIYTDGEDGDNADQYPDVIENNGGDPDSVFDISRAIDLEKVVLSSGIFEELDASNDYPGELTVVGVRNAADVVVEGYWYDDLSVFYAGGTGDGIKVVFNNVVAEEGIFVGNDSPKLTIESTGGANYVYDEFTFSGELRELVITGDAFLRIDEDSGSEFDDETAVTIDASANTGGFDFIATDLFKVTFLGSEANDRVTLETDEYNPGIPSGGADQSITVVNMMGDNTLSLSSSNIDVTVGDGDNTVELDGGGFEGDSGIPSTATVVAGNGANRISGDDLDFVNITAGDGGNFIAIQGDDITIATGAGDDTLVLSGDGNLSDLDDQDGPDYVDVDDTALINIDVGGGDNKITFGGDVSGVNYTAGITALEGSTIAGENITLYIEEPSDLREVDFSGAGIDEVILSLNEIPAFSDDVGDGFDPTPVLTITDEQFMAIGAENMKVEGSSFGTYAQVKVIMTGSMSLDDMGVDNLPANVDLQLELQDGVQLEITAEQLHTKVAPQGITLANDNNEDELSGSVLVTDAGLDFDPFNNNDAQRTDIFGNVYNGGSLSPTDFADDAGPRGGAGDGVITRDEWGANVLIDRSFNGYDRPADSPSFSRIVIDTDEQGGELMPFSTIETFLRIIGDSDMAFVPSEGGIDEWGRPLPAASSIILGADEQGDNPFLVDFSDALGAITNLTFGEFERVDAMYGNGSANNDVRVNVEITEGSAVAGPEAGLVSQGIQTYVVTDITTTDGQLNGIPADNAQFWTSRVTEDLEVLGLCGNYDSTITFGNTERGVSFLLEVKYDKFDGYAVGTVIADFARPGADAEFNVVGLDTLPAGEYQMVVGIDATDASTAEINVTGGDTYIEDFASSVAPGGETDAMHSIVVTGDADVKMGMTGGRGDAVSFLDGVLDGTGVVGDFSLMLSGEFNWAEADVSGVDSVHMGNGSSLIISNADADEIGPENFILEDGDTAMLNLVGLNDQPFSLGNYDPRSDGSWSASPKFRPSRCIPIRTSRAFRS